MNAKLHKKQMERPITQVGSDVLADVWLTEDGLNGIATQEKSDDLAIA